MILFKLPCRFEDSESILRAADFTLPSPIEIDSSQSGFDGISIFDSYAPIAACSDRGLCHDFHFQELTMGMLL
jgi:hypothetical protein